MVYAYYRVSTQTQAERNSTQMQIDVVEKYARENGIVIENSFCDEGVSGTLVDRPGMIELLSVLEKGDKVIVQNTSRLWRSDTVKVMLRKEIEKAGADVISTEQPTYSIYSKDPNDFLINSIFEILDQYEKMQISLKLYKGRKAKSNKGGKSCGTAPYGYKWDNNEIVVDYNNNLVVEDIFNTYLSLKSLSKLESYCNEKNYKTTKGNNFSKKSLANILHNEFYVGVVEFAGKKTQGKHQPIVDLEIFNAVQDLLTR